MLLAALLSLLASCPARAAPPPGTSRCSVDPDSGADWPQDNPPILTDQAGDFVLAEGEREINKEKKLNASSQTI